MLSGGAIQPISWRRSGSRARPAWLLVHAVPWIDAMIVAALFWAVAGRITLAPSIAFELPAAPFSEGAATDGAIVAFNGPSGNGDVLVFFDDIRYILGSEGDEKLISDLTAYARTARGSQMLLLADENVRHGDVMRVVNLIRSAGVKRVNVAVKPE